MTLDLAALRLLAWQGPFNPCGTCAQTQNHRCKTASGNLTTPHEPRLAVARGYVARQPEVDGLTAQVEGLRASNDQLVAALKTADDKIDMAMLRVTNLTADLADANAKIAELETPPVPEPPAKQATQFGACILDKGAAGVVAKFGKGAAIRQYMSSALSVPVFPAGSLMHVSFKAPSIGWTDAQIDSMLKVAASGAPGMLVTFNHEPDNDGMTGAQIAAWKDRSNRLYDRNVALGRPCLIAPTFTGDFWSNHTTDAERDVWLKDLKGDLFGLDFDGVHDNQTTKPTDLTYRVGKNEVTNADEIAVLQKALTTYAANGWTGFCVPEFGTSRAAWDTDGLGRTKWINDNAARFIAAGCYYVAWFDQSAAGKTDVIAAGSPELDALRALVAAN